MKLFKVYQVEVGVLLSKDDPEYESYSQVWDHKNAYYDEDFIFCKKQDEAKSFIENYINAGVVNTYGILSETYLSEEFYDELDDENKEHCYDLDYSVENVIYSAYKNEKNETIENFVDNKAVNISNLENEEAL